MNLVPEARKMWTRRNHICRKTDTVCTRIKRAVVSYIVRKQVKYRHVHDGYGGVPSRDTHLELGNF